MERLKSIRPTKDFITALKVILTLLYAILSMVLFIPTLGWSHELLKRMDKKFFPEEELSNGQ